MLGGGGHWQVAMPSERFHTHVYIVSINYKNKKENMNLGSRCIGGDLGVVGGRELVVDMTKIDCIHLI